MEEKDLQLKLDELKSKLEESLTKKAKDEITLQLKTISEQIEALKTAPAKADPAQTKAIEDLSTLLKEVKEAADKNQPVIDAFVAGKDKPTGERKLKSFEQVVAEAAIEATDDIAKFVNKETKSLVIELKGIDQKTVGDMGTANVTGGTRYGQLFAPNIIDNPYRKIHVRDLIPMSTAGPGNTYTFMKEDGDGEGAIAPTAETAAKPQIDLDLVEASVNFETIAGWLRVTRKAMRNIPGFVAWLQRRLPEKLMKIEDTQILYGDGNTPNLKGIGTAGNFTAATSTALDLEEALIDGLSQMEDSLERYPTGIVVRPKAYYNFFKNKASTSGVYDLPKNYIFQGGILYISGVPVIPTTAVTAGDYFIGDWIEGTELLVQENMRLEFFEQDGINVRENKITLRIEETVALPVYGASYFIKGADVDQS